MADDSWEKLRHETVDGLVTVTKLSGSASMLYGWTTPEGYPFVVVVAVASPGNERVVEFAREFHEKLSVAVASVTKADRPR